MGIQKHGSWTLFIDHQQSYLDHDMADSKTQSRGKSALHDTIALCTQILDARKELPHAFSIFFARRHVQTIFQNMTHQLLEGLISVPSMSPSATTTANFTMPGMTGVFGGVGTVSIALFASSR